MKHKIASVVLIIGLLTVMLASTASAALPTNMSWVKYASNPVLPNGTCGVAQPSRPAVVVER